MLSLGLPLSVPPGGPPWQWSAFGAIVPTKFAEQMTADCCELRNWHKIENQIKSLILISIVHIVQNVHIAKNVHTVKNVHIL